MKRYLARAMCGLFVAGAALPAWSQPAWKAWMTKNDVTAPSLRGAELTKYLDAQYKHTHGVLVELGLAK